MLYLLLALACADKGDTARSDGSEADADTDADADGDTDTGPSSPWAGTWQGDMALELQEGGFAVNLDSCTLLLTVGLPEETSGAPLGNATATCTPSGISSSTWTFTGETLDAERWSGSTTVVVPSWREEGA